MLGFYIETPLKCSVGFRYLLLQILSLLSSATNDYCDLTLQSAVCRRTFWLWLWRTCGFALWNHVRTLREGSVLKWCHLQSEYCVMCVYVFGYVRYLICESTPIRSCMLQADSEKLRQAWIQAVQASIASAYREISENYYIEVSLTNNYSEKLYIMCQCHTLHGI